MIGLSNFLLAQDAAASDFAHAAGPAAMGGQPTFVLMILMFVIGTIILAFFVMGGIALFQFISGKKKPASKQYDAAYEQDVEYANHAHSNKGFSAGKGFALGCAAMLLVPLVLLLLIGSFSLLAFKANTIQIAHEAPRVVNLSSVPELPQPVLDSAVNPFPVPPVASGINENSVTAIPAPKLRRSVTTTITSDKHHANSSTHARLEFKVNPTDSSHDEAAVEAPDAGHHYETRHVGLHNDSIGVGAVLVGGVLIIGMAVIVLHFLFRSDRNHQPGTKKSVSGPIIFLGVGGILAAVSLSLMFYRSMEMQEMMVRSESIQRLKKHASLMERQAEMSSSRIAESQNQIKSKDNNAKQKSLKFWMKEALKKDTKEPYRNATNDLIVQSGQFTTPSEAKQDCVKKFERWLLQKYKATYPDATAPFSSHFVQSYAKSNYEDYTTSEVKSLGDELEAKLYRNYRRLKVSEDGQLVSNLYQVYKTKESENRAYYLGIGLVTVMMVLGGATFFLRRFSVDANRLESTDA